MFSVQALALACSMILPQDDMASLQVEWAKHDDSMPKRVVMMMAGNDEEDVDAIIQCTTSLEAVAQRMFGEGVQGSASPGVCECPPKIRRKPAWMRYQQRT